MKKILVSAIFWKIVVISFALIALYVIRFDKTFTPPYRNFFLFHHDFAPEAKLPYLVWIWGNFDGTNYTMVARNGYNTGMLGFFPLYPLLMHLFSSPLPLSNFVLGLVISNVCFLFALYVIKKLLDIDGYKNLLNLFLLVILSFPTSFFYGAVYNDSLFFILASACLYYGRKKHFLLASICGFFATLARLNGLALFFFIGFEYLSSVNKDSLWDLKRWPGIIQQGFKGKNILKYKMLSILLIPGAFLSYLAYIQLRFGDWYFLFTSMKPWGQDKITFPLQVVWRYLKIIIFDGSFAHGDWISLLELSSVLLYVIIIIYAYKKIRFSYWVFLVISILIPSLTGTFQGMPRYSLHLYPLFLAITLFLSNKSFLVKCIYFIISLFLLFLFTGLFTRGYFIA